MELPNSLKQLHEQFAVHKTSGAVEPLYAAELRTVDDVYLSVLQNLILVSNVVLVFTGSIARSAKHRYLSY